MDNLGIFHVKQASKHPKLNHEILYITFECLPS